MLTRYLIDGSNFIFRAYYALDELTGPDGHNANAVYGFFRMLLNILREQPTYILIARDTGKPTKRKESFDAYKANRTRAPDDLKRQIMQIHDLIEELGIPYSSAPGYEADDVLYTYSHLVTTNNLLTTIYTSDKDMKQLINTSTHIVDPMKRERRDYDSFYHKWGFAPEFIVDYLALVGDASDNVPGVPGIGAKTASNLISTHHTIDTIYHKLDTNTLTCTQSVQDKLIQGRTNAFLSKELITLLPLPDPASYMTLDDMSYHPSFDRRYNILVEKRGFHSFASKITEREKLTSRSVQGSLF